MVRGALAKGSTISVQTRIELIRLFCAGWSATHAASAVSVSRRTVTPFFRELRRRLVEDQLVNGGVWNEIEPIPPASEPMWQSLWDCIYACKASTFSKEFPTTVRAKALLWNKDGKRRKIRISKWNKRKCQDCPWKLTEENFSSLYLQVFLDYRWKFKRVSRDDFRDHYFFIMFITNFMNPQNLADGRQRTVGIDELTERIVMSLKLNPLFRDGYKK